SSPCTTTGVGSWRAGTWPGATATAGGSSRSSTGGTSTTPRTRWSPTGRGRTGSSRRGGSTSCGSPVGTSARSAARSVLRCTGDDHAAASRRACGCRSSGRSDERQPHVRRWAWGGGSGLEGRDHPALEELELVAVGRGEREVADRVAEALVAQARERLDDLLRRPDERAAAPRRDVVVRLLGEPAARVLLDPGQAVRDVALGLADDDVVVGRPRDLADVAAQVAAVLLEHGGLVGEALGRSVEVRVLGVLRRDAQRLLLAAARDPQGDARQGALAVHDDPLQGLRV